MFISITVNMVVVSRDSLVIHGHEHEPAEEWQDNCTLERCLLTQFRGMLEGEAPNRLLQVLAVRKELTANVLRSSLSLFVELVRE